MAMKKIMLYALLLALACGPISNLDAQVAVTIGQGSSVNSNTTSPSPYGIYDKSFRQQYLYRMSEIQEAGGGSGMINSLAFNVQYFEDYIPMTVFRIRLKHTDQTELSTIFEVGNYQEVFVQNNFLPAAGWNTHTFSAPFAWNGTQNLLVELVTDLTPTSRACNSCVFYTSTIYNSTLRCAHNSIPTFDAPTGGTTNNRANIRFNMAAFVLTAPPNPAMLLSPADGGSEIRPATVFSWVSAGGVPTGYRLNFGTNNPPNNIEYNLDLAGTTSYTPPSELAYDSTYYWQIIPYNSIGSAANCPVWSFSTHGDPIIQQLPHTENWDAVTPPDLPFGWSAIVNSTDPFAKVETYNSWGNSPPNSVKMLSSSVPTAQVFLISPKISAAIPMNSIRIKAWLRSDSRNYTMDVGVMTDPADSTTFELVQTINFGSNTYAEYSIWLRTYAGEGRFIAFRHGLNGYHRSVYIDDIILEEIATNDLAATAIRGNITPSVNTATNVRVDIYNNGSATQDNYLVKLIDSEGAELTLVPGLEVATEEVVTVTIPWFPDEAGAMSIHARVVLAADANPLNDETLPMNVSVQAEGIHSITIGDGDETQVAPWNFLSKSTLFQSLYFQDEIEMFGSITALDFYADFANFYQDASIKLWLGSTTLEDLSAGWIDPAILTLVYDGTMDFPAGEHTIRIPLQVPFTYSGGNLVLYACGPVRVRHTDYVNYYDYFRGQTVGNDRARILENHNEMQDPLAPSYAGILSGTFPKATFYVVPFSAQPSLVVSPPEHDFGTVTFPSHADRDFYISNIGGTALGINDISISGSAAFTLKNIPALPGNLNAGQTLVFGVEYSPSTEGGHTAQILISDNITREVHIINLSGVGYDATIYSLPYTQNWDDAPVPYFPLGWSCINDLTQMSSLLRVHDNFGPYSTPNCVQMRNYDTDLILISPIIDSAIDTNDIRIKFMMRSQTNASIQVGTIVDPTDPGTFEYLQTHSGSYDWTEYIVNLSAHTGVGRYLAFKLGSPIYYYDIYIDDIIFEEIYTDDLAAISIMGNTTPCVNTATDYTVSVFNNGANTQASYLVQLVDDEGTILASAAGEDLAVSETANFLLTYTPSLEGARTLWGKVLLTGDNHSVNDLSFLLHILVQPEDIISTTIGAGDRNERIPWAFNLNNSLFQCLYYADEFDNFGQIIGIAFYNDFLTDVSNTPLKLWLGTTGLPDLGAGWIDPTTLTLVFDSTMSFPAGQNIVTIPLNAPFDYFSGNLVLYTNRPMDLQKYNQNNRFLAQAAGANRARILQSNHTMYDPMAPSISGYQCYNFPKTTFFMNLESMGALSGTVTTSGSPLADVEISIDDTYFQIFTPALGQYGFPSLQVGNHTLSAHKIGYEDQSIFFSIVEDQTTTVNIAMFESPSASVTGTIVGSDDPMTGLVGGVIHLYGIVDYIAIADASGQFVVEDVLSAHSYDYVISRAGYRSETGTIIVGAGDHQMNTIILNEIAAAPYNVMAEMNSANTAIALQWEAPDPCLESFEGVSFPPQDWSQIITNTDGPNSLGVDRTFRRLGTIATNDANSATPTHGSFQAGLWWSHNHQDEWLITPTFNCPADGYLRFDSYVYLGSQHGGHLCVEVSTDAGNSWQVLWDARLKLGGLINYFIPFVVDLAAYGGQQINLAFHASDSDYSPGIGHPWFIDNIYIGSVTAMAKFDGPILVQSRPALSANLPTLGALTRDDRAPGYNSVKTLAQYGGPESRALLGYDIYRFVPGQEDDETSWTLLNDMPINTLAFEDEGYQTLPGGSYRWGIKAIYSVGLNSPAAFSNPLSWGSSTGRLVGFITGSDEQRIAGATVTANGYSVITTAFGTYSLVLPTGIYSVSASAEDYKSVTIDDVIVPPNQDTTLNISLVPSAEEDEISPIAATALKGNSPNPFNPTTTIYYDILEPCNVRLDVYNIKGQKVRSLLNEASSNGRHNIVFDARDDNGRALSSGVYFYRFSAGKYNATRKMLLME